MSQNSIGVVTLTRQRPDMLRRVMASVYAQDYDGDIEHIIIIDDDPESVAVVESAPTRPGLRNEVYLVGRPPSEVNEQGKDRRNVYPRMARLFNTGVRVSSADWIAFLDDDNEFAPNHLTSLMTCARANNSEAVHSGRTMHWADGEPYLEELWHTTSDPSEGARIYNLMCERGVRIRGTNVLLDRADSVRLSGSFHTSTVIQDEDPVLLVDQSVWLLRRELLLRLPIPETFTDEDHATNTAPDDKLLGTLIRNDIPLFSTGLPTVRYYLGGISNNRSRH